MDKIRITVFTPTFNRGYIIGKLYESLKRQSFSDFEWIVVDDGSTDNTEDLFKEWRLENNLFPIEYYKKPNGGKYKAINYGLDLAHGVLFFIVDSDDYLTDDALELIDKWEKDVSDSNKYCGIAGNMSVEYPTNSRTSLYYDGDLLDRYRNISGERPTVFYTDLFKHYKFPEFEDETFMTEAVPGNRMAHDGYRMRFYEDIIVVYKYREDGLTKAGLSLFIKNPKGYGLWLREKSDFTGESYYKKMKMYYAFMCDLLETCSLVNIAKYIGTSTITIYACFLLYRIKHLLNKKRRV